MNCVKCQKEFEIYPEDREFYLKIDVPAPTHCPECRNQRRMTFRNERHLYQRNCDFCKKRILSIYDTEMEFPVYCYECWWSDGWNPLDYGQEYDPQKSFFEQFRELTNKVPHLGLVNSHNENCDYVNFTNYSKNCYLIFGGHSAEDCYYGWRIIDSLNCLDCAQIGNSKYCYDCLDCDRCYGVLFSQDSINCSDSAFLYDCRGCQDCLFSAGLRNKRFVIFNQEYSEAEFKLAKEKLYLGSYKNFLVAWKKFEEFLKLQPRRAVFLINCENVSGDHILNSKNVRYGFNVANAEDCAYLESCAELKDSMDCTFSGWPSELNYEGISAGCVNSYETKFASACWSNSNLEYTDSCHHSRDLFGCFGLHQKNANCILNKQYSEKEFVDLKIKIIADMKTRGEYGEFFPSSISPFAYNETVANDYYPLKRQEVLAIGLKWKEVDPKDCLKQNYQIPDDIQKISGEILKEILACEGCGKNYKITIQELDFYKKFELPIPRKCFNCRHQSRIAKRNPRKP